ncbi:hypothetical protein BKA67DRAFT_660063 [Truncatella angustata]|uniref:Myb-like domain-containing protein n=1 Tax=Truncatella angustata TaxID=152316 RepID=A0A9P8UJW3_9PEZI|nr:uncharacterized protein BKA67DRAFT_660063 [Truncatella angustata]KAH6653444.1 hypothetical protein BKA67DRAFT_660063 [Truncatella angustata]
MAQHIFKPNERRAVRHIRRGMIPTMHNDREEHHVQHDNAVDVRTVSAGTSKAMSDPQEVEDSTGRYQAETGAKNISSHLTQQQIVHHEQEQLPLIRHDSTTKDITSLSDVLTDDETISIKASTIDPSSSPMTCSVNEEHDDSNGPPQSPMSPTPSPPAKDGYATRGMMGALASPGSRLHHHGTVGAPKFCATCGFSTDELLQLCEKALQFHRHDKIAWNTLVNNSPAVSSQEKNAAMLRISLWAIRDYALTMRKRLDGSAAERSIDGFKLFEPPIAASSDSSRGTACTTPRSHLNQTSDVARYPKENDNYLGHSGDQEYVDVETRGRPAKRRRVMSHKPWSPRQEETLRAGMEQEQSWEDIARRLGRTPAGVRQHWWMMERRFSPRKHQVQRPSD